jgi:hypothetical protein
VPWCRFFIPKIASPRIRPGDPDLNEHISYAKCIKGHVIRNADDWVQCENLPDPDAKCWQEGGETLFTLTVRKRNATPKQVASPSEATVKRVTPTTPASKS